ncbi:MAG: helicase-exonuclease AddAB subunit AddA [Verrucomicrobiota bacterium]
MNLTSVQQTAITARGNVLVVAGARTRKTSTLVQRCMALLESGCSLENILMVTFTEAAAVEMRGRIREALQAQAIALEISGQEPERANHLQKQVALLDTALISTLHGFCLQLVREHFYELGIDPDISVLDEQQARPLIQQILDSLFERHYGGETPRDRGVQKLVRVAGRGSDERHSALILKLHRYVQSLAAPEQWIEAQQRLFSQAEPTQWREWFIEGVVSWRALWKPLLTQFTGTAAVDLALAALRGVAENSSFLAMVEAIQNVRAADDDKNWPRGSKGKIRKQLEKFFDEAEFLVSLTPREANDPLAEDWELVRHDLLTLLELTREFSAEFSRMKRESGGVDFADLEQFALRILRDPQSGALTEAALRWQQQFEHVFVDEYQDINAAQDAILSALSRTGAAANRFLVGDVKQSIYRFRLADPTIFRGYEKLWFQDDPHSQRLSLADNFRSRKGILDFINPLFRALMRDEIGGVVYEELNFGNPAGRAELALSEGDPRVELHLIARADPDLAAEANGETDAQPQDVADLLVTEREARLVGLRLLELKQQQHAIWDKAEKRFRPVTWGDMAILLRSPASRVEAFAKEFASLGIPLAAARGGFFESTEISDLVCLLKLLDNPLQDISLLAVLRSPLVGMSLPELGEIRARENPESRSKFFWLAARQFHQCGLESITQNGDRAVSAWRKLDRFFQQLQRWRERLRHSSLSHCLETALTETHYEILLRAKPRGEQQLANVRGLLDLAREYDPYQRQGLFRFLQFIQAQEEAAVEVEPAPASGEAVHLTSIHRSKGLEFPVVVLAGMGWQFNSRDLHEAILLDEKFGLCPKVSPPDSEGRYPSLPYWLARQRQQRELLGEELRLLYVAMTRARDTLVLTASSARKGAAAWSADEARPLSDREVLSARNYLDWLKLWLPQVTQSTDWIGEREGKSPLLSWKIYDENDARLALPEERTGAEVAAPQNEFDLPDVNLPELRQRLAWEYPWSAATTQRAKTSVTELRRNREDEDAGAAPFIPRNTFTLSSKAKRKLSAAEVGVVHHRFLERLDLNQTGSLQTLQGEAERLAREGWFSEVEVAALDFKALAKFWATEFGRKIAGRIPDVHRELQFTAGLQSADLAALNLESAAHRAEGEVVVIQGVVDLAVILPDQIWIVDFKTDAITELELPAKVKTYEPQLKLYALALSRIYRRPVTECALYFLANQTLAAIAIRSQAEFT